MIFAVSADNITVEKTYERMSDAATWASAISKKPSGGTILVKKQGDDVGLKYAGKADASKRSRGYYGGGYKDCAKNKNY